jgi:chitinase
MKHPSPTSGSDLNSILRIKNNIMLKPFGLLLGLILILAACKTPSAATKNKAAFDVIAYYSGDGSNLEQYHWEQMTQVIYSFCHLRGNELAIDNSADSLTITKLTWA